MFLLRPYWLLHLSLSLGLLVACFSHSQAQLPLHLPNELFAQGLALLQKEQYESAQYQLEAYIRLHGDTPNTIEAQYCAALCAIQLGQPDGEERFRRLTKTYPQHPKTLLAYYQLGNFYFSKQDFAKSIPCYLEVDQRVLDQYMQCALQYRLAYAYLNEKNFEQAKAYFDHIKTFENAYCYAASYYTGCLAFKDGDYATALDDLMRASENPTYRPLVSSLVLQIYYHQERFLALLDYANAVRSSGEFLKNEDEIILLTAEAHFFMGHYATAATHYEEYIAHKDFIVTSEILYRTAYALYQAEEGYKALKYFKKLALQEDAIGQVASYYAGLLYIRTNQKPLALAAFDKAQQADFHVDIREEAAFQYAKVSYDLGDFVAAIEALQRFKQGHAASKYLPEADALLGEAYLHTHDYDLAIMHIEGLSQWSKRIQAVYQKITFCKGSIYFNDAAYDQAVDLFRRSLQHPCDQSLATQAQLWLGESLSGLRQYEQAIPVYRQVLSSTVKTNDCYPQAIYGLGYAYFNTANYTQALSQFVQYVRQHQEQMSTARFQDALVRLADCHYATKEYQQALQCYHQVTQYYPAHVHYQQGVIYGIFNDREATKKNFQIIFDDYAHTAYYEKALFETAHIDLLQSNYLPAIEGFTKLIHEKPHSPLLPDALLSRAIAHVNLAQYGPAIQDYEQLLQVYPQHPNAQSALLALSRICILEGKPERSKQYLAQYQAANLDAKVLEQVTFDTAKALFYDQRYTDAVEQLQGFITNYPKSQSVPEALFLVAEAYYRQDDVSNALAQYQAALKAPRTPFYNKILLRIGTLAYKNQDFSQAFASYQQLKHRAQSKKEDDYALVGMMKASYALQHYEEAQQYALLVIEKGNLTVNAAREATLLLGKSAMQQGRYREAQTYFTNIAQKSQDRHAVEAQYLLAKLHYTTEAYQQSLKALFELNKRFPSYKAWTDKGFLLIAQNYLALKEDLQAKATLQSIVENAEDEALVASAQQMLATLAHKVPSSAKLADTEEASPEGDVAP